MNEEDLEWTRQGEGTESVEANRVHVSGILDSRVETGCLSLLFLFLRGHVWALPHQ